MTYINRKFTNSTYIYILQNKKQRMLVRQAVLKGKDPVQLLTEMEIIDQMGKIKVCLKRSNG